MSSFAPVVENTILPPLKKTSSIFGRGTTKQQRCGGNHGGNLLKTVTLVTQPTKEEKEKFAAREKNASIRHLYASRDVLQTSFLIGSRIAKSKIYAISEFMTCRERMTQFINSCVSAKTKMLEKQYNYATNVFEYNIPNPAYYAARQMRSRSNLMILGRFPYPSRKNIRLETEAKKEKTTRRAEAALRVLNYLEDLAEWRRTELFSLELDDPTLFKRKNFIGFCFSGPSAWFDSPYSASIFALIIRTIRHRIENFEQIVDVDTLISVYKDEDKDLGMAWETKNDATHIRKTVLSWAPIVKNFKKILGARNRSAAYSKAMGEGIQHAWQQGITVLCDGNATDKEAVRRLYSIGGRPTPAW